MSFSMLRFVHVYRPTFQLVRIMFLISFGYYVLEPLQIPPYVSYLMLWMFGESVKWLNCDEYVHNTVFKLLLLCGLWIISKKTNGMPHYSICERVTKYKSDICAMCQTKFVEERQQFITFGVLSCGHCFHKSCLSKWELQLFSQNPLDFYRCCVCKTRYDNNNKWHCKCDIICVSKGYVDMITYPWMWMHNGIIQLQVCCNFAHAIDICARIHVVLLRTRSVTFTVFN
eukprot:220230_1